MCLTLVFNLQAFKLKQIKALIVFDYKFLDDVLPLSAMNGH